MEPFIENNVLQKSSVQPAKPEIFLNEVNRSKEKEFQTLLSSSIASCFLCLINFEVQIPQKTLRNCHKFSLRGLL